MSTHTTTALCDRCEQPADIDFGQDRTVPGIGRARFLCADHASGLVGSRRAQARRAARTAEAPR